MTGKIAHLPLKLRDQLNQRLANSEDDQSLLDWLNSLPEVQTLLQARFDALPISRQNLSKWKKRGFRDWLLRLDALELIAAAKAEDPDLAAVTTRDFTACLNRSLTLRLAAAAQSLDPADQPQDALPRLHQLCADLLAFRRTDQLADRLALDAARLHCTAACHAHDRRTDEAADEIHALVHRLGAGPE
jgi:hypothetical protein